MATMVGTQKELGSLLRSLLELEYDAIEAYKAAVERLQGGEPKAALAGFMADHERHVRELEPEVRATGEEVPNGPDMMAMVTKGKVVIGGLMGDPTVLLAMKTNEDDTNKAYERATQRTDLPQNLMSMLQRNLADERRHRASIEQFLHAGKDKQKEQPAHQ